MNTFRVGPALSLLLLAGADPRLQLYRHDQRQQR
jgi:hypothetical protein